MLGQDTCEGLTPEQVVEHLHTAQNGTTQLKLINCYVEHRDAYSLPLLIELFRLVPADYRNGNESFFAAVASDIQESGPEGDQFLFDSYAGADELRAIAILMTLSDARPEDPSVTVMLHTALDDDRPLVIEEAIGCLRHRGDTFVFERILGFTDHPDPRVRGAVLDYVIAFDPLSAASLIENTVAEMREVSRIVCTAIEMAATMSQYTLLLRLRESLPRLDAAAITLPKLAPRIEDSSSELSKDDREAIRKLLRDRLGTNLDFWEIFDPFEGEGLEVDAEPSDHPPEPVWWSLPDVLAEIYEKIKPGLQLLDDGQPTNAIWTWRMWHKFGGAREVLSALRAIHHLLDDEHIVPVIDRTLSDGR